MLQWLREVPWWHGPTLRRYWLFQVPGTIIIAFLLGVAIWMEWISSTVAVLGVGLWVLKDFLLFPFTWRAYFVENHHEGVRLQDETATVVDDLNPIGYVRTHGELWRARLDDDSQQAVSGESVRILRREGMLLHVTKDSAKTLEA